MAAGGGVPGPASHRITHVGELRNEIIAFVTRLSLAGDGEIGPNTPLFDGYLDSLTLLRLVNFVEERCGVAADRQELTPENWGSVARIEAYVRRAARAPRSGD